MFAHLRETQLVQFAPARAKKKLIIDDLQPEHSKYMVDQKIDGERYIIQTNRNTPEYQHGVTSRRVSEVTGRYVEKTDRVPHLSNHHQLPQGSMIDTEFVSSGDMVLIPLPSKLWDKLHLPNHPHSIWLRNKFDQHLPVYPHVSNTVSIMGSLGPEAVRKQQERGLIWAYAFDMVQYMFKDISRNTQVQRKTFLARQLETVDPELGLVMMPSWINLTLAEIEYLYYVVTDPSIEGEGLVIKDPTQVYNAASNWYKIKRDWPADAVYTGVSKVGEAGKTGKMLGMAASLEIGVYHNSELIPVGWISAIRDGEAGLQTPEDHAVTYAGKAVEIRHNGLQEEPASPLGYTLRHPRFRRPRNDKNPTDCTWDALYEEAKTSRK